MTATATAWDRFRADVEAQVLAGEFEHVGRLTWDCEQIARAQRDGLGRLLSHAAEHSPFHRRRLAGIDPQTVDPRDMSALPVMTKADMMAALDDVFTDRRLRRSGVEAALAGTAAQPVPILDDYIALASGGSSGCRGLFVFDRAAVTGFASALSRSAMHTPAAAGAPSGGLTMALVAAASAVHATGLIAALTASDSWPLHFESLPATLPLADTVSAPR